MNTIHVLWFIKDFNLKYKRKVLLKCHYNLYIHIPICIIWLTLFPKVPFLEVVAVVHRFHSFPSQCPDPQWVHHWCRAKENASSHITVDRVVSFKPWLFYPHGNSPSNRTGRCPRGSLAVWTYSLVIKAKLANRPREWNCNSPVIQWLRHE